MARETVPVRIRRETRDNLLFLKRELGAHYNRDYAMSDVIDALMHGYSGNPKLAEFLRSAVDRKPDQLFPSPNQE